MFKSPGRRDARPAARFAGLSAACLASLASIAVGTALAEPRPVARSSLLIADERDGANWPAFGRTYSERHASPLTGISAANVSRLGLAWSLDLPGITNGATIPLAVDGIVYFTVGQSIVHAVEAASGRLLWRHDPEVAKHAGRKLRITWGPRGIGYWEGKIYVGTTDGRLLAIDAKSGREVWSAQTVAPDNELTITGPPRVFNGKVIIGNAGSEFGANRGYVTAYDAESGEQAWRFWIVPGNPADGFENAAMEMAAKTWTGEWWKFGGGGQAWNAMTYDPEFNRVYIGTGNGGPWNRKVRSPGGHRHRQWRAVEPQGQEPRRRRHPVPVLDRRARRRYRRVRLALPDDARRDLGLQLGDGHHAGDAPGRRQAAAGDPARAEERLLLRDRPRDRQGPVRGEVRQGHLGRARRPRDGPAGRGARRALRGRAGTDLAVHHGRAQLAADVLQRADRARVHPDA
ncbi:MAG: PQQ-binding-like beta-propeller repeat protein, partial [Steroidobacteraceae bacterium]|nr:PQQ-binding-like beta-propeller repeat protein [Steroidobacteraceae bacterium]